MLALIRQLSDKKMLINSKLSAAGLFAVTALATLLPVHAQAGLEMWRLDCGEMKIDDISFFSDTFDYDGESATISNGCYLVRNGDQYLLWDLGLAGDYLNNTESRGGWTSSISVTLEDQLERIGVTPDEIRFIAISHHHGDHIGQAKSFPNSTLLISQADFDEIDSNPSATARRRLAPWFEEDAEMTTLDGDHDVFDDGTVTILSMPGHTPGHGALLVRLPDTGPVLLSGDLYHFRSEIGTQIVSNWNTSRSDTLASYDRFNTIIERLNPTVIAQHDPLDIDKLPRFPNSAR